MTLPVLQEHVDGEWRTVSTCGVASHADRCAGCDHVGHVNHVGGLRAMARRRAGLMPDVLPGLLPGGPRPTRVVDGDGRVVDSFLPP